MTSMLEHLPSDTHPEVADTEVIGRLSETIHEAALAVQKDPRCEEKMGELEHQCVEAARLLLSTPEIASEIVTPLGEAAQALYKADSIGPKVDLRVTETLGEIAAGIPTDVAERRIFVKIAMKKATEFFHQQHAETNEIGKELDEKLLEAFEKAIDSANVHLTFHEAFEHEVIGIFAEVEAEYVDPSNVAEYRRDQLLQKSDRLANYAHNGRNVDIEMTGAVVQADVTGPIQLVAEASNVPSHNDEKAYDNWKRNLAGKITFRTARQAMLDDEFERVASADDINAIRAELSTLYPAG